jgi:hypothetical protein
MNTLVYLTWDLGPHTDELIFSVLSALRFLGCERSEYRVVVYTVTASAVANLPVHVELLSENTLAEWTGRFGQFQRRKVLALKHALGTFGGRVMLCDTDTFFMRHPREVFARVRPGHTVMHIGEYHLSDSCARTLLGLARANNLCDLAGHRWNITERTAMFNAGVIGIDDSDMPLLDEVLHLNDQIYAEDGITAPVDPRFYAEQFAFSVCFQLRSTLHQAHGAIRHYWTQADRARFHGHLGRVLRDDSIVSADDRFERLWPNRPGQDLRPRPFKEPVETDIRARMHRVAWRTAKRLRVLDPLKAVVAGTAGRRRSH